MKIQTSIPDNHDLMQFLNQVYDMDIQSIYLYRNMIGAVYFLSEKKKRYAYKLYQHFDSEAAIQSSEIIDYLHKNDFPVVPIIPTKNNTLYSTIKMPEGKRVGILFEYIEGEEPSIDDDIFLIGELTGRMHRLMERYNGNLRLLGKDHYIDRFIETMQNVASDKNKLNEMKDYGDKLWEEIKTLPKGFCHGDLHSGNLIKTDKGEIIFYDFDIASISYPIFDVSIICNKTDFWKITKEQIDQTIQNFKKFYQGYEKEKKLTALEKEAILHSIAIHHYELNGTIPLYSVPREGNHWLNERYFNLNYSWMIEWQKKTKEKYRLHI